MRRKDTKKLLAKKNVISVGVGEKVVGGKGTGKQAIVVGVTKKLPKEELSRQDLVPSEVNGYNTDVIEVGEIQLLSEDDPTARFRPCPAGVSVGHYMITAGTLGAWVKKNCDWYILSNNHVLANVNEAAIEDIILQPGNADGGKDPDDMIGALADFVPIVMAGADSQCPIGNSVASIFNFLAEKLGRKTRLSAFLEAEPNKVDCAIALVKGEVVLNEVLGIGQIIGEAEAYIGDQVQKAGRTSGVTIAPVAQKEVTVSVNMGGGRVAIFEDQLLIQGATRFSKPGDSGSAVLNMNAQIVGLLFAGSDTVTIANRYYNVKDALGINIPKQNETDILR